MHSSHSTASRAAMLVSLIVLALLSFIVIPTQSEPEDPPQEIASPQQVDQEKISEQLLAPVATGLARQTITILAVKTLDFSPDGSEIAVGGGEGIVRVWEVASEFLRHQEQGHENWLFDLAYHPRQKILATAGGDNLIKLWNMSDEGWTFRELKGHTDDLHGIAFTTDGTQIVSGSDDTTVRLWDLDTLENDILGKHDRQVTDIEISTHEDLVASSSRDGTVRLWDLQNKQAAGVLKGHSADVLAIAFSPDGKSLASASYDKTIILWDVSTLKPIRTIPAHDDWVFCVTFSPDGQKLASGGGDNKLKLWDVADGTLLEEVEQPSDISVVAFSPDGKSLVAGRADGYLKLYRTEKQLELFKTIPPASYLPVHPTVKTEELTTEKFLELHQDLLDPENPNWEQSLGKLTASGDRFTLKLLDRINPDSLSPPKQELWTRVREQIRRRTQSQGLRQQEKRFDTLLTRAATADLQCHPLETSLKLWTLEELQSHLLFPSARRELQRIRDKIPKDPTKLDLGLLHDRKQQYIQQLLKGHPEHDTPYKEPDIITERI